MPFSFTKHEVLKEQVGSIDWVQFERKFLINRGFIVFGFLKEIFLGEAQVFSGSIEEVAVYAEKDGDWTPKFIRLGFGVLQDMGLVTIDGDIFTPTKEYLRWVH
jgi:hypothetical protein